MSSHNRRNFLSTIIGGVTAGAVFPRNAAATTLSGHTIAGFRASVSGLDPSDEAYWRLVKQQFPLRPGLIIMNAANLCPSPYPVVDTVAQLTASVDADASFQNRAKFDGLREAGRHLLAEYLDADPGEIAITRNTSESNNTVVNGLTLGSGDEVVIWDQNHPTNNVSWDVRADRHGFTVKKVATPPNPQSSEELFDTFVSALSANTRVLSFSHVSNASGVAMPAKELCEYARERGILTLVDGAQTFGAIRVDVHDLGCDFYTGSSHKWFIGPKEAGVLYVRSDQVESLWPSNVGVGWAAALENGATKFENLGQRDDAAVSAMGTAAEFHNTIGIDRVEARVRALAAGIKQAVSERFPNATFVTPIESEMSAGVVVFALPGVSTGDLYERLYRESNIACAARADGIRFSPHIYNTMDEVGRVVEEIARHVG